MQYEPKMRLPSFPGKKFVQWHQKVYSGLNQCVIKKGLTTGWTSTCLIFSFIILMYKLYFKKKFSFIS